MGNLYVGCNSDSTGGTKVATETYVNTAVGNIDLTPYATNTTIQALENRVAYLETQIASLMTALQNLTVPQNAVLDESGTPMMDE